MPPFIRYLLPLLLLAILTPSARAADSQTQAVHDVIRAFVTALSNGDVAAAHVEQEWSLRYVRILGKLQGTLSRERDGQTEFYAVTGVRSERN